MLNITSHSDAGTVLSGFQGLRLFRDAKHMHCTQTKKPNLSGSLPKRFQYLNKK